MRVCLVDPAAFTLPYDHALARALAAQGAEVELVSSRFRFGDPPAPDGYTRRDLFYPVSSRLFRRSRLRLPVKAAEHALGLARLRRVPRDIVHVQWAPLPQLDARLMPAGGRSAITAHDILPRRTAGRIALWRRLYCRYGAVVAHSAHGARRLVEEVGVPAERVHTIAHPVFPGGVEHHDDGRTLLFFGLIQGYKQLDHAIAVAREVDARLIVAGDPLIDLGDLRRSPGVEWRLGYQSEAQLDELLANATVALFPYRPELDQSGALLRALGAGTAVAAYDAAGIAEPVSAFGAGVVAAQDDLHGLAQGVRELLTDPAQLERARAGARRAREILTWEAAAAAHMELYRQLLA